ncbi:hypothetical protein PYW08_000563 [Mythimna loreyi]|uniref:Uncharacterized protein n=1 Tax=Mythimna loreyi TaxID=667449 RepID=A0ACC2RCT4_9NEOP|nr:hypothetical protein PYW08_000563 [Mythimna loreyi]
MVRKQCQCEMFKCKCLVPRGCRPLGSDHFVFTTRSLSLHRLVDHKPHTLYEVQEESETNLLEKTQRSLERFYDTCAGYNLRYCSIAGFVQNKRDYFKLMMIDVVILICFLATNFVVFSTILCKTFVHVFFLIVMSLQWILRVFIANASSFSRGSFDYNSNNWPSRTEEIIRTLGLNEYPTKYPLKKCTSNVFTNTEK